MDLMDQERLRKCLQELSGFDKISNNKVMRGLRQKVSYRGVQFFKTILGLSAISTEKFKTRLSN